MEGRTNAPALSELAEYDAVALERSFRQEIESWLGVPHRLGGTDRGGIDCSGLAMVAYDKLLGITLPRVSSDQIKSGLPVDRADLMPGDLVFFKSPGEPLHEGIFLCCGEFAHASSSSGVTISSLESQYWSGRYKTARRIIQTESGPDANDNKLKKPTERVSW